MSQEDNIFTARLRIEPLQEQHAGLVYAQQLNADLYTYIPQDPLEISELKRRYTFLQNGISPDGSEYWLNWVAFMHETNTPIGTFQATIPKNGNAMLGYTIFRQFWRRGFAKEMSSGLITYIFNQYQPKEVFAEIDSRNIASIKLVESLGFNKVKFQKNVDFFKGESSDEFTYTLTDKEWVTSLKKV